MLKWLVKWLNRIFRFPFGRKKTRVRKPVGEQKVVQQPPELTNADLEFLFTQLLEGVHQARGQQWALKYLQRMENRISLERWINWLLDFGERLLTAPTPNNQLAERMVQLGELGIGTIGELSYDIGIRLLTRNLSDSYWDNENSDTATKMTAIILNPVGEELPENLKQQYSQSDRYQQPETTQEQEETVDEVIWEYTKPDIQSTELVPPSASEEEQQEWVEYRPQTAAFSTEQEDDSLASLQPDVTEALDELLVRLEQSKSLAQHLASDLTVSSPESPLDNYLLTQQQLTLLERAQAWFYQGLQQAKSGDLSGAIASYDQAVKINPNAHEYWFNRGLTLSYLGDFAEAIASYNQALVLKPDFYKYWYYKGSVLGELGQFDDAIVCFNTAIEIKYDYLEALSGKAMAFLKSGRPLEAISNYDKALLLQPQDQDNWYYRGMALGKDGRSHDSIASYDQAIEIQPDFSEAWYSRGVELFYLERWEDAIDSLEQATTIQPNFYEAWYTLGNIWEKLGKQEEAIAAYDHATEIKPDSYEVWIDRGVVLANLGAWGEAISSWEQALEVKPDFYLGWFNRAVALENLGRREDAIASYNRALEVNPNFHLAWYNRAVTLFHLNRFEEAIFSYDNALQIQPDYWEAWLGRGAAAGSAVLSDSDLTFVSDIASANPVLYERGYEGKLASYSEGLKYVLEDTQPEGWGRLHIALGNAHYDLGKRNYTPRYYWQQAVSEYNLALNTLTLEAFPQLYLEVMQNLIKTLAALGETFQARELQQYATESLQYLLNQEDLSDERKQELALKNIGFWQLSVDIAMQLGEIAQAVEIAEHGKNACLTWQLMGWRDEIASPTYPSMHALLNPKTALIYWHISPCTLRTFIIKYKSPEPIPVFTPVLNVGTTDEMPLPETVQRFVEFEDWLVDWNQQYEEYRTIGKNKFVHSWQTEMEQKLLHLKEILNISSIVNELEDITHLILIPHRDLQRLPLHSLFNLFSPFEQEFQQVTPKFMFTYLPSVQVGLALNSQPLLKVQNLPLLCVESPDNDNYPASEFTKLESTAISQMFQSSKCIQGLEATKDHVETALAEDYNIFHFGGYVTDNFIHPQASELILANEEKLTLKEVCLYHAIGYSLITFSTCETGTSGYCAIATEYVGLVSALLSQGVNYIVSTLWKVESSASTLVMIEFYRKLLQVKSPATALAEATEWLKELTAGDLKKWYDEIFRILPQEGSRIKASLATELYRSSKLPVETKLYNHPYYWAAFAIYGKFFNS
ncbi:MAG: tetratricopeptide repeat protein [Scytonema sp. PMC 1069.18]|nr:tetratricopeptide repeat protein [Scytonema sp. PMC 1069.18]MEC4882598.1 tetratricopeptide repeat protein [Scytonema sp. PMC 1070.18]